MNKKLDDLGVWRFAVATAFLNQLHKIDDKYIYYYSRTKMELDIEAVKLAMINNIEGAFKAEYGMNQGVKNAELMYCSMLENPELCGVNTEYYKLSQLGHELMTDLFESLVTMFEKDMATLSSSTIN